MPKPLDVLPAVPGQTAVMRMVSNLMQLRATGMVTQDEYITIRTRIARWDLNDARSERSSLGARMGRGKAA